MAFSAPVPIDQLANTGSSVTIEETVATTPGGKPRRVVLVGAGLPFMGGASWTGESNVITTWYPGNGVEASQQNLGAKLMPSTWAGEWKRTLMGRTPSLYVDETGNKRRIVDPHELWAILDDIRICGARLRVTWAVRGREIVGGSSAGNLTAKGGNDKLVDFQVVREGRMKSLKVDPERLTDMKWTAEFHWVSSGRKQEKNADVRRDADVEKAASALSSSINAVDAIANGKIMSIKAGVRLSVSSLSLGQLEALANAPLKALNTALGKLRYAMGQVTRAGALAKKLAATPYALANSVLDFARNSVAVANQFVDEMGRQPPELQAKNRKTADLLRAAKLFGQSVDAMRETARSGTALDQQFRQHLADTANRGTLSVRQSSTTRAGDLLAIHVCKTGDTPQRVSSKYYANPDQGESILRANRMPMHTPSFRPGQILVIPVLTNAPRMS